MQNFQYVCAELVEGEGLCYKHVLFCSRRKESSLKKNFFSALRFPTSKHVLYAKTIKELPRVSPEWEKQFPFVNLGEQSKVTSVTVWKALAIKHLPCSRCYSRKMYFSLMSEAAFYLSRVCRVFTSCPILSYLSHARYSVMRFTIRHVQKLSAFQIFNEKKKTTLITQRLGKNPFTFQFLQERWEFTLLRLSIPHHTFKSVARTFYIFTQDYNVLFIHLSLLCQPLISPYRVHLDKSYFVKID